jgi:hypothetical protein
VYFTGIVKVLGSLSSATNELLQELCAKCICNLTHRVSKKGKFRGGETASAHGKGREGEEEEEEEEDSATHNIVYAQGKQ